MRQKPESLKICGQTPTETTCVGDNHNPMSNRSDLETGSKIELVGFAPNAKTEELMLGQFKKRS